MHSRKNHVRRSIVEESFFDEFDNQLTSYIAEQQLTNTIGKQFAVQGNGDVNTPYISESSNKYELAAEMLNIANLKNSQVFYMYEGCKYVAKPAVAEAKVAPGATKQDYYGQWTLRWEIRPVAGSKEYRGLAVHNKSALTPNIKVVGLTADDAQNKLVAAIDSSKSRKLIDPSKYVNIDFNVLTTRDIVGHKDEIYCDIEHLNGAPALLISSEQHGGMIRATDRTALAQRGEHRTGQHAFRLRGDKAAAAGLTHARYTFGAPFNYFNGGEPVPGQITAYPLKFSSEVHPGEVFRLNEPGIVVAYPRGEATTVSEAVSVDKQIAAAEKKIEALQQKYKDIGGKIGMAKDKRRLKGDRLLSQAEQKYMSAQHKINQEIIELKAKVKELKATAITESKNLANKITAELEKKYKD